MGCNDSHVLSSSSVPHNPQQPYHVVPSGKKFTNLSDIQLKNRAFKLVQQKQFKEAIVLFLDLQSRNAQGHKSHNQIAFCYKQLQEYQKAIQFFRREPEPDATNCANIAQFYIGLKDRKKAQQFFDKALSKNPIAAIYFAAGKYYQQIGKINKASQSLAKAAQMQPSNDKYKNAFIICGKLKLQQKNYENYSKTIKISSIFELFIYLCYIASFQFLSLKPLYYKILLHILFLGLYIYIKQFNYQFIKFNYQKKILIN